MHTITKISLFTGFAALLCSCASLPDGDAMIDKYVAEFNAHDEECYVQKFPNTEAAAFMKENIPVFECPDKELEKTYYFRWWTYRKHVKETAEGYIITEFLPEVPWAGKYNAIPCPGAHHIAEGRWLDEDDYLEDYIKYWCRPDSRPRSYSFPFADAVLKYYDVTRDLELVGEVYPDLKRIYADWADHRDASGLYWQCDGNDGMEVSISGQMSPDWTGYRATLNSYMYADAMAISKMAELLGKTEDVALYAAKADTVKTLLDAYLWDEEARFYKVIPRNGEMNKSYARELHGYVPWLYDIPSEDKNDAWLQLIDPQGFKAPYGPTTAEQRAEGFKVIYSGHECQWNGPSWPFATAQTLTALAQTLHHCGEGAATKDMYFETLQTYSNSHRNTLEDGTKVCWIDENLDPFTGEWIARKMLKASDHNKYYERGKDYNHSTFCDLIISGLVGVQPQHDGSIVIEPLIPEGIWDYFCLTDFECADKDLTILYDKTGKKYHQGKGFMVFVDGKKVAQSDTYSSKLTI